MIDESKAVYKEKWRWSAFWQRLKKREVTSEDLDALFFRVIIPLMLPSISPIFINTEGDLGDWALRTAYIWIAPPLVAICCILSYWTMPDSQNIHRKIYGTVAPVFFGLIITGGFIGYFDFANALTGSDVPVAVSGPVVRKGHSTGRTGFNAYLTFLFEGREVTLKVPVKDYDGYNVGDIYGQTMYRGGFGYFYRWNLLKK